MAAKKKTKKKPAVKAKETAAEIQEVKAPAAEKKPKAKKPAPKPAAKPTPKPAAKPAPAPKPEKTAKEKVLENLKKFYVNDYLWKNFRMTVAKYAGSFVLEQRRFRRLEREQENLFAHLRDEITIYPKKMFEELEKLLGEKPVANHSHIKYSKNSDAKFIDE